MELQRVRTGYLAVCDTVSGLGHTREASHNCAVACGYDNKPSAGHCLGASLYDAARM